MEDLEEKVQDATLRGDLEQLKALLKEPPLSPDSSVEGGYVSPVFYGNTPLIMASIHGNVSLVEIILKEPNGGGDVDAQNQFKNTALSLAASFNHLPIMHHLIAAGANVNRITEEGWSILMKTAYEGHLDAVEFLVQKGADVHWRNELGHDALHYATKNPAVAHFLSGCLKAEEERKEISEVVPGTLSAPNMQPPKDEENGAFVTKKKKDQRVKKRGVPRL